MEPMGTRERAPNLYRNVSRQPAPSWAQRSPASEVRLMNVDDINPALQYPGLTARAL